MKTTERFDRTVNVLYAAFSNGTLDAMDCKHCAVGNMCDNSRAWVGTNISIGEKGRVSPYFPAAEKTGYTHDELSIIEHVFLYGTKTKDNCRRFSNTISTSYVIDGYQSREKQRELQFKGLMAVLDYLAELDGITTPSSVIAEFKEALEAPVFTTTS